ncbi:MAG: hypothetical protein CMP10_01515 [Zetaproteobacteria bacterium]|nr:hypothetical protein [Pseudobdellovibrionaceae bacterium]
MSWDPIHTAGFTAAGSTTVTLGPYTAKNQQDFRDKKKACYLCNQPIDAQKTQICKNNEGAKKRHRNNPMP